MEKDNEVNVAIMTANTFILQPTDKGVILTFMFFYLRNTFIMLYNCIDYAPLCLLCSRYHGSFVIPQICWTSYYLGAFALVLHSAWDALLPDMHSDFPLSFFVSIALSKLSLFRSYLKLHFAFTGIPQPSKPPFMAFPPMAIVIF